MIPQHLYQNTTNDTFEIKMNEFIKFPGLVYVGDLRNIINQNINLKETNAQLEFQLRQKLT